MKQSDDERRVRNQFGCFCIRVLKHELRNIVRDEQRQSNHEKPWSELSPAELAQLKVMDKYFSDKHYFRVLGKEIVVADPAIAEAIKQLSGNKRDIILLSYFLGMSDTEISKQLNTMRQTISKRRADTLKPLKEILEKEGFIWQADK